MGNKKTTPQLSRINYHQTSTCCYLFWNSKMEKVDMWTNKEWSENDIYDKQCSDWCILFSLIVCSSVRFVFISCSSSYRCGSFIWFVQIWWCFSLSKNYSKTFNEFVMSQTRQMSGLTTSTSHYTSSRTPNSPSIKALQLEYAKLQKEPVEGFTVKLDDDGNLYKWHGKEQLLFKFLQCDVYHVTF